MDVGGPGREPEVAVQYDVQIGDRVRTVRVARDGDGWRVLLDGAPLAVAAARVDDATLSLLIAAAPGAAPSRSVRAVVRAGRGADEFDVHVNGRHVALAVRDASVARRRSGVGGAAAGPQRLVSPMPGKVVRVLVREGDAVAPRQGLVVVEAMKMENELRAAKAGRVVSVAVREGQSVDAGAVLAVVE